MIRSDGSLTHQVQLYGIALDIQLFEEILHLKSQKAQHVSYSTRLTFQTGQHLAAEKHPFKYMRLCKLQYSVTALHTIHEISGQLLSTCMLCTEIQTSKIISRGYL